MSFGWFVGEDEHKRRIEGLRHTMERLQLDAVCLFGTWNIYYYTGFAYQPTERPTCAVIPAKDNPAVFAPQLEKEHLENYLSIFSTIMLYPEYPGERPVMDYFVDLMKKIGLQKGRLGCDSDGYGGMWGSHTPSLTDLLPGVQMHVIRQEIEKQRSIKSSPEIEVIKESARLGNLTHRLLQEYTCVGLTEIEVGLKASMDASITVMKVFGEEFHLQTFGGLPAEAGFKAGPETAFPHPLPGARPLQQGDLMITWAEVFIDGYHAELERTMLLGDPDKEKQRFFNLMCDMQGVGIAAIKPGRTCSEVDHEVIRFAQENGVTDYVRHHTGHGIGLEVHEGPFLDRGDQTVLQPGMIVSVEPGLYVPGVGGFRHSDTVLVTEDGNEVITYYPRSLEKLIIPV